MGLGSPSRQVLAAALSVAVAGSMVTILGSPLQPTNPRAGVLSDWSPTKGQAPRSLYAGPTACAGCHPSQAEGQHKSLMGRAVARPTDSEALRKHPELRLQRGAYSYEIRRQGDQIVYAVGDGTRTISEPLVWAFGFGALGQTYIFARQGAYYETRVSYFTALDALDITVGHSTETPASLEGALGNRLSETDAKLCFSCHSTAAVANGRLDSDRLIPGVTCEACHGPGARHVAAMKAGRLADKLIFNPGRLEAEGLIDFCGACHRTALTVLKLGQRGPKTVRFQPYRLVSSQCWNGSDPRITCVACHSPHQLLEHDPSAYDAKCLACHQSKAGASPDARHPGAACTVSERTCVTCHMRKVELPGGHGRFSDHYIRVVRPGEAYPD